MTLTYGGIPLACPTGESREWVDAHLDPRRVRHFQRRAFPDQRLTNLPQRVDYRAEPIRLGSLFWPVGATRWAEGHFLCSDLELGQITPQAYSGNTWNALPLVYSDGPRSLTASSLYMLPPRPLGQCGVSGGQTTPGRWLLTLVDARYRWWDRAAALTVTAGTTTWLQLFAAIALALGIVLTVDTVAAAYLTPPADFGTQYEHLPTVLDAACLSVGQRLVASYDGSFSTQNATTAAAAVATNLAALPPFIGGGQFRLLTTATPNDLLALAPSSFSVANPQSASTAPLITPVTLASLALPEYGSVTGNGDNRVLHSPVIYDGSNGSQIATLAQQMATDTYRWQLGLVDEALSGAGNWIPEALHDIEWLPGENPTDPLAVRVSRFPWNDVSDVVWKPASAASGETVTSVNPGTGDSTITLTNATIQVDLAGGLNVTSVAGVPKIAAQNASATHAGAVSIGTQTIAGHKNFLSTTTDFGSAGTGPGGSQILCGLDVVGANTVFGLDSTALSTRVGVNGHTDIVADADNGLCIVQAFNLSAVRTTPAFAVVDATATLQIGQSVVINYTKVGGAAGTLTFTGGILTAHT